MPFIRRLLLFLFVVIASRGCLHAQAPAGHGALFSFNETVHDFGKVPADTFVTCKFEFVNRGDFRLIINDITLSCPCFSADWSREPVMPGDKGWVSVRYPTAGKAVHFDKVLWITSNAVNNTANLDRYELRIKGIVQDVIPMPRARQTDTSQAKHSGVVHQKHSFGKHRKPHRK